ncbi:MAG: hypothetical protein PVI23_13295 [Maricaulaceae bacterium]|jgi:hypothetical protein
MNRWLPALFLTASPMIAAPALSQVPGGDADFWSGRELHLCEPARDPLDAVTAAPEMHEVVREDHEQRVLAETLAPGERSNVHIHALPSVIQGEAGGADGAGRARFVYIEYAEIDGALVEVARRIVTPAGGFRTAASGPEGPHAIENVGEVPLALTRTEFKPDDCEPRVG